MTTKNTCDPFEKLNVRLKGAPRSYTLIHHILYEFTPRELIQLERVNKNWNKVINSDTELWWNKWMSLVWGQKNITGSTGPKLSEANLKELALLQNALTFSELNSTSTLSNIDEIDASSDNMSYTSSVVTLTDVSTSGEANYISKKSQ